jgi:CubicO group peptidase (beta-lactamase class C family)
MRHPIVTGSNALRVTWWLILGVFAGAVVNGCATSGERITRAQVAGIEKLLEAHTNSAGPGCVIAIIKDGEIIYERGYGSANLQYGTPITPLTVFNVASVAKQFTAMSILLLVKEGELSLDDDVRKYIPEVPDYGKVITLRHLMHHTSGLRNYEDLIDMAAWRPEDALTREHMLHMIARQKELNFAPGQKYLYCNTGYILLAEIVARVSRQSFREFTDRNIFKPLGMTNTHFHDSHTFIVTNGAASYYFHGNGSYKNAFSNSSVVGGGGLYSTVRDLLKWLRNFDHARVGGPQVLKQMHERGVLNSGKTIPYGGGLFIDRYKGVEIVGHGGGTAGWRSDTIRFPSQGVGLVLLGNVDTVDNYKVPRQIAELFLKTKDAPKTNSRARRLIQPESAALEAFVGDYELEGFIVTVRVDDKKLMARAVGQPEVELVAESENGFLIQENQSRVLFERDDNRKVTRLILEQDGESHPGPRVTLLKPEELTKQIGDYAGEYYSDELETSYTIKVRNNEMFVAHPRLAESSVTPTGLADKFIGEGWFSFRVVFTRDNDRTVTGFRLSTDRTQNVLFKRRQETTARN